MDMKPGCQHTKLCTEKFNAFGTTIKRVYVKNIWTPDFLLVFQNRIIQILTSGCVAGVLPIVANNGKKMLGRSRTGIKKRLQDLIL